MPEITEPNLPQAFPLSLELRHHTSCIRTIL